ncbi:hypothetical protein, partial [Bifidobacterium longum]|uniref:hypothetical protein n=1 Tax=Bifidobacterium longum TaxID=216816 RepID=UPI0032BFEB70
HPAENPLPTLRKNTAHKADANLLKHTHAAALVIPAAPPSAAGASERARTRAHADLEHGLGTQRRVDDPHVLDHRAFDVEKLVEYAAHQALFGCAFLGR